MSPLVPVELGVGFHDSNRLCHTLVEPVKVHDIVERYSHGRSDGSGRSSGGQLERCSVNVLLPFS